MLRAAFTCNLLHLDDRLSIVHRFKHTVLMRPQAYDLNLPLGPDDENAGILSRQWKIHGFLG